MTTTGSGATANLGTTVAGFLSFPAAGAVDGTTYRYSIMDPNGQSEIGTGVYSSAGSSITRNPTKSTNSNNRINLSGNAQLVICLAAEDLFVTLAGSSLNLNGAGVGVVGNPLAGPLYINTGGIVLGSPSGGDEGAGTINVSGGYYVNGVQLLPITAFAAPAANSVTINSPTAGSATTTLRSNATFQLSQAISPTWTGVHNFSTSLNITGAEGFQLGWQIAGAGQSWHMNLNAAGLLYIQDVTHTTFPFQINPSAPNGLLCLAGGVGIGNASPTANTLQVSLSGGVIIDTAVGTMLSASSANTGGTNQALLINSGTSTNSSTVAQWLAQISGLSSGFAALQVFGGSGGSGLSAALVTGSGLTNGLNINSGAGPIVINPATTLQFKTTGTERARIDNSTGFFNIGPALTPDSLLTVNANTANTPGTLPAGTVFHAVGAAATASRLLFDTFAGSGNFSFRRADGTITSPSAVQIGDTIALITGFGYGTTGYSSSNRVSITFVAAENWTDTAQGTFIPFSTTASGGTSTTEKARIWGSGGVSVGSTTDPGANNLSVAGIVFGTVFAGLNAGGQAGSAFQSQSSLPSYAWESTGQATDQKWWDALVSGTQLFFRAVNDANSLATSWLTVNRGSGFTIDSMQFFSNVGLISLPSSNFTAPAVRMQVSAGESTNAAGYAMTMGYALISGSVWTGYLRASANSIPTPMVISASSVFIPSTDNSNALTISGGTNGVRFVPHSGAFTIEGVDNTGVASYQPLTLGGSSLQFQNSGSPLPVGSLGIASTLGTVINDGAYVTPQMYGAVGNGTTDDTTALQNCFNSGKPIWLVGKFKITSAITVNIGVGQTINGLAVYGGGQQTSQILCANTAATITVNMFYTAANNNLSANPQIVLRDFCTVATVANIGSKATFSVTTGIVSSGSFNGLWNLIGKLASGTLGHIGSQSQLGILENFGMLSDGTGTYNTGLYMQDMRCLTLIGVYMGSGIASGGYGFVYLPTIQPGGNSPDLIEMYSCQTIGGASGCVFLPSGAANWFQTGTFTLSSANISGTTFGTNQIGCQVVVGAGVPTPFVAGNTYFIVASSGGNIQLSSTSGGSPITVTGTTHTATVSARTQDWEGFYVTESVFIGCTSHPLVAYGTDASANVIKIAGSTFGTAAGTTGLNGIYCVGVGSPQIWSNDMELAQATGTITYLLYNATNNGVLNGFGAIGQITNNSAFGGGSGVTMVLSITTGGTIIQTGNQHIP